MSTDSAQAPFRDVQSFEGMTDVPEATSPAEVPPVSSPFLAIYETGEGVGPSDLEAEDYTTLLNELHDEEMEEALLELAGEATRIAEGLYAEQAETTSARWPDVERALQSHFEPLAGEVEALLEAMAGKWGDREPSSLAEAEIDEFLDQYRTTTELSPAFEEFFGRIGRFFKKAIKKVGGLAMKGIRFVGRFALWPILRKIKALVRPLLRRVIRHALGRLPATLRPVARRLGRRLGIQMEQEDEGEAELYETFPGIAEIHREFNAQIADLLLAGSEEEQELALAEALAEPQRSSEALADLDEARERFVQELAQLKDDEDPTPKLESFVPVILPALRLGIRLIGRKRVVGFLARLLGKLIRRFVGPRYAQPLSRAIVDAGFRLIRLEASAEDEARAAGSAVATLVEETIRRVSTLPDHVLEDEELLEAAALEAFEQSAAANLPPVLSEATYRSQPRLRESVVLRGTWILMPLRGRRKRYKKYTRVIKTRFAPHKLEGLTTSDGASVAESLEEQLGIAPGEEVEAEVHLYETLPGSNLTQLAELEADMAGMRGGAATSLLHPLDTHAAGLLLGEPGLGREPSSDHDVEPSTPEVGQRFYYLSIPGRRPLRGTSSAPSRIRRRTKVRLVLDFPTSQIRVRIFLSEVRAQSLAQRLRQRTHFGLILTDLRRILSQGLSRALAGRGRRLKIVHEAVPPEQWIASLRRLPYFATMRLLRHLTAWSLAGASANLRRQTAEFIAATEHAADGITLIITIVNPPGFAVLRRAFAGKLLSLGDLRLKGAPATITLRILPGYVHE